VKGWNAYVSREYKRRKEILTGSMETLGMWENYYLDAYEYTKEVSGK
jgi:hypothetical protein